MVFGAAREISEGNMDLSQRTEAQAGSLQETASAMEQLANTLDENVMLAEKVKVVTENTSKQAQDGARVVAAAVESMSEIKSFSRKISDIIGVIDEIAFQTNLLALNAAVEAARAGEQGRGFAVVAAEVRNLAQRSASSAKEIKSLINTSIETFDRSAEYVEGTGETFGKLGEAISEVVGLMDSMSQAVKEQSLGIKEVNAAISQMDAMTQQNAALVEQAAASSKSLEDQAQRLVNQVSEFTLDRKAENRTFDRTSEVKFTKRLSSVDDEWKEF